MVLTIEEMSVASDRVSNGSRIGIVPDAQEQRPPHPRTDGHGQGLERQPTLGRGLQAGRCRWHSCGDRPYWPLIARSRHEASQRDHEPAPLQPGTAASGQERPTASPGQPLHATIARTCPRGPRPGPPHQPWSAPSERLDLEHEGEASNRNRRPAPQPSADADRRPAPPGPRGPRTGTGPGGTGTCWCGRRGPTPGRTRTGRATRSEGRSEGPLPAGAPRLVRDARHQGPDHRRHDQQGGNDARARSGNRIVYQPNEPQKRLFTLRANSSVNSGRLAEKPGGRSAVVRFWFSTDGVKRTGPRPGPRCTTTRREPRTSPPATATGATIRRSRAPHPAGASSVAPTR